MRRIPVPTSFLSLSARESNRLPYSSNSTGTRKVPVQPRPSGSLVVVNERNEVLLVHRNPNASAFAGMHVFPGGNLDETQGESLEITAIRETFEESGLLLASTSDPAIQFPSEDILGEARCAIHEQRMNFGTFLQTHKLRPNVGSLLPFTQWVTPAGLPRRFKTQFYVTFLPPNSLSASSSGPRQEWLPTHDGKREVIKAQFMHPQTALEESLNGQIRFMPPQFYILSTLADIFSGPISTVDQRKQVKDLSSGAFGKIIITPRKLSQDKNGHVILALNGDETHGGPMGCRHRILGRIAESGTFAAAALIRNLDILNEIDTQASTHDVAKL